MKIINKAKKQVEFHELAIGDLFTFLDGSGPCLKIKPPSASNIVAITLKSNEVLYIQEIAHVIRIEGELHIL